MSLFKKLSFNKEVSFQEIKISEQLKKTLKEEENILQTFSSTKRQLEFRAGRIAAHIALKKLKDLPLALQSAPLLRGSKGEVLWPEPFIGSISHSHEYAVAIVSTKTNFTALGIDIEYRKKDINNSIYKRVLSEKELLSIKDENFLICFSAKEAIYKAVYSKTKISLGWQDITLFFNKTDELFADIKKNSLDIKRQKILVKADKNYILTAVFLE